MKRAISFILIVISLLTAVLTVSADEYEYFIICNPKSHVNVRKSAKKGSDEIGRLYAGDSVTVDGMTKNGFVHCVNMSNEWGEGWVYKGYLVQEKPIITGESARISANGRVKCRRYVNGKRQGWARDGDTVKVYAYTSEWALTSKGFIKTEFIDLGR